MQQALFLLIMFIFNAKDVRSTEPPSLDDVVKGFSETKRILFEETPELALTCRLNQVEQLDPTEKTGRFNRAEWVLARKKNMWKTMVRPLDESKRDDGTLYPMDPVVMIVKDGMGIEYRAFSTYTVVNPLNKYWNIFQEWKYFNRVGYGVSETIVLSNSGNYKELYDKASPDNPLGILRNPDMPASLTQHLEEYSVHDKPDMIDGHQCWIVEWPEHDKMWVDPECGYAIRRRTSWFPDEKTRHYDLANRDFKEVKPGLWLPMTQVETCFGNVAYHAKKLWDKPIFRYTYRVSDLTLSVPSERFDFSPPVGSHVLDVVREDRYTITDEGADPFAGPIGQGIKVRRFIIVRSLLIICGSVLIFIALWRMLDKKEKENEKKP